ncbi:phospholipase D [Tersicoccus solisilvae]|uniref:Phospholipase D n=1 Tax=Tersicoccus solisilvae TaxID=1882339 RepID=A0ABQ1P213_9MICC|nr:phospholipase D-like domain-containing protein [Tersicoccus solisilvae]GGC89341.1 phospholipase D [Tersicoccus solisilvae]
MSTSWYLRKYERDNRHTRLDDPHPGQQAHSSGNVVRPLIHGAVYFAELYERIEAMRSGDLLLFTDWRGDPDERMTGEPGSEVSRVLGRADERGVDVRGLVWRSHWDKLHFSAEQNRHLIQALQDHGAETLLDMRVRTMGSHHQKFVVLRHRNRPEDDIAYVGGIDLCHSRRDDARHGGDPQPQAMADEYGDTPPWHDVQLAIQGPAVHDVETVFRERWEDPTPLTRSPWRRLRDALARDDTTPDPLPERTPAPAPVDGATHHVQLLRTYPDLRWGMDYPFAVGGERSVARGYTKALDHARRMVYIEDQYLWSTDVADRFDHALRTSDGLHVLGVLPRFTDQGGATGRIPQLVGRERALRLITASAPERVAFYGLENRAGQPVYVHAKVCIMDDTWASVGSDNFNRRSWTHDSELSAAVIDDAGEGHSAYARRLRLRLAAEHLDRELPDGVDDDGLAQIMADCLDEADMFGAYAAAVEALEHWYDGGRRGPRPPGRLRRLQTPDLSPLTRAWAEVLYRTLHDPDGRPRGLKRRDRF